MSLSKSWIVISFSKVIPLLVGVLLGVIAERIIRRGIRSDRVRGTPSGVIIDSFKGWILPCSVILGVYLTLKSFHLAGKAGAIVDKSAFALLGVCVTFVLSKVVGGFVDLYTKRNGGFLPSTTILTNLIKVSIIIIGFLIIINSLGVSIAPILTGLGIGGLAVALALQNTLANFFAGLQIIASGQIRPGDFVRLESGEEGYIVDITWRNTVILELPNNLIIVPNSKLAQLTVRNFDMPQKELTVIVEVGVSYNSDLDKVERVTIEVAKEVMREVTGGVPEFDPFIRYNSFGEYSINFSVILRAKSFVDRFLIVHEFIKRLHKRYKEEGIEIPFPIRTVHIQNQQV